MFRSRVLDSASDSDSSLLLPLPAGSGLLYDNSKNRGALIGRCITRCRAQPRYATAILVVVVLVTTVAAITARSHITNMRQQTINKIQHNAQAADHIAGAGAGAAGVGVGHKIHTNTNTNTSTNTAPDTDTDTDTSTPTKQDADQAAAAAAVTATAASSTSIYTFDNDDLENKRNSVKDAFRHAWTGYERACWGRDELKPLSNTCEDWLHGGLTIIDSLSTLYVMSLSPEISRARDWVKREFRFDQDIYVSFFESTIRVLGGLLSAYSLSSGDSVYLAAARIAGQRLLPAFGSQTGIPASQVNLRTGGTQSFSWTGGASLLAEIGTVQMEFTTLSHVTRDQAYREKGQHVIDRLDQMSKPYKALYPIFISAQTGSFTNQKITLGAMGDSFYEYLLKMWLLTGKTNSQYVRMYRESADAVIEHLYTTSPKGDAYLADLEGSEKLHKMDHLVCFAPGMFALGVAHGAVEGDTAIKHLDVAKKLMETCYQMYVRQPSGLAPEYVNFQPEMTPGHDQAYKLRPETVESLMILYRVTHDPRYREWGWSIFQGIERSAKVPNGYATVRDVTRATTPMQTEGKEDKMESFFLAETLKYLYLLFSPDTVIPITPGAVEASNEKKLYVFNTECHPLQAFT